MCSRSSSFLDRYSSKSLSDSYSSFWGEEGWVHYGWLRLQNPKLTEHHNTLLKKKTHKEVEPIPRSYWRGGFITSLLLLSSVCHLFDLLDVLRPNSRRRPPRTPTPTAGETFQSSTSTKRTGYLLLPSRSLLRSVHLVRKKTHFKVILEVRTKNLRIH